MSKDWYQTKMAAADVTPVPFDSFDPAFHDGLEQLKRRIKAQDEIKPDKCIDHGDHYIITGSKGKNYITSADSCTCTDFKSHKVPCKHIYRFALDHSLIDPLPKVKNLAFNKIAEEEISRFYSYYKDGLISAQKLVDICSAIRD